MCDDLYPTAHASTAGTVVSLCVSVAFRDDCTIRKKSNLPLYSSFLVYTMLSGSDGGYRNFTNIDKHLLHCVFSIWVLLSFIQHIHKQRNVCIYLWTVLWMWVWCRFCSCSLYSCNGSSPMLSTGINLLLAPLICILMPLTSVEVIHPSTVSAEPLAVTPWALQLIRLSLSLAGKSTVCHCRGHLMKTKAFRMWQQLHVTALQQQPYWYKTRQELREVQ